MKITWQDEFISAIKNETDLELFLDKKIPKTNFSLFIPQKFLNKIKLAGPTSPLWKQFIPSLEENNSSGLKDPIGDQKYLVTKNLIHRYHNRALFIPTINCPVSCRYCFRKNELEDNSVFSADIDSSINYLNSHPEIEEIIFTGGDPLILSDEKILFFANKFSQIPHIKFLRFHSRTPIILPSRIDEKFIVTLNEIKKKFSQVSLMIHVNHEDEIDQEVTEAILQLLQAKILLFSQTVLLKDINDNKLDLRNLFLKLGTLGVIPYYLHHPDQAYATDHFQLSLVDGRKIYSDLRNMLPGWLLPKYIIDIPGGDGKVPAFNPESFEFSGKLINLRNEFTEI
jgi:lysine 2,3-aminomutase